MGSSRAEAAFARPLGAMAGAAGFKTAACDAFRGLEKCVQRGWRGLALVLLGLVLGWWVFVPLHELLHAAACELAGGTVSRLEIASVYGGALLARVFPFVVPSSDYAGRLSGFDTRGSDWIYLATDLGPYVLTLFPGAWALRKAARSFRGLWFGFWLPFALSPFLSLTGDAYEIGSLLVTQIPPWSEPSIAEAVRGDDLFLIIAEHRKAAEIQLWIGTLFAALVGFLWSGMTYSLADQAARALGEPPLTQPTRPAGR